MASIVCAKKSEVDDLQTQINNYWEKVYPVGAIYMSTVSTSPSTLFGGTWEQIKDRFLLAAGDTYKAGATGGEATHTLTVAEMPSHNHTVNSHTHSFSGTTASNGAHTHTAQSAGSHTHEAIDGKSKRSFMCTNAPTYNTGVGEVTVSKGSGHHVAPYIDDTNRTIDFSSETVTGSSGAHTHSTTSSGAHTHTYSGTTGGATPGTSSAGSGSAHNNMPPYLVVYIWKRTA